MEPTISVLDCLTWTVEIESTKEALYVLQMKKSKEKTKY
jgi:hypothetical protein